ncbi:hypothetical protein [Bradyrhizobium sp.]|uniref:hypothetical protein n=1 Tax=Bradyrhizobium sp. TaxID=376 RepID=UPI003C48E5A0
MDRSSAATGINPPGLYAVFRNMRARHVETLARYWRISLAATPGALAEVRPVGAAGLRSGQRQP